MMITFTLFSGQKPKLLTLLLGTDWNRRALCTPSALQSLLSHLTVTALQTSAAYQLQRTR